MSEKQKIGNVVLDEVLDGGLMKSCINMVYGSAATGKTTMCMVCAIEMAKRGGRVLFLDSENGFSIERMKQLAGGNFPRIVENILVIKIRNFQDQKEKVAQLHEIVERGRFKMVILDTIGHYYRKALKDAPYRVNKDADDNFKVLKDLAKKGIIILISNQVYANFREKDRVEPVGGKMFKNWSGLILELRKDESKNRKAVMMKPGKKEKKFKITAEGFIPL